MTTTTVCDFCGKKAEGVLTCMEHKNLGSILPYVPEFHHIDICIDCFKFAENMLKERKERLFAEIGKGD